MKCHYATCHSEAEWFPVLCLRQSAIVEGRTLVQAFGRMSVCYRHKPWVVETLLSDPWFSGYAAIVERVHGGFKASRHASEVRLVHTGVTGEAA